MHFFSEKCSNEKALQESTLITFPKSALLASPTTVPIYKHRGRPLISNPKFYFVILLVVK
jgi:hypothetical protein